VSFDALRYHVLVYIEKRGFYGRMFFWIAAFLSVKGNGLGR
jgi:hypothetical protein